METYPLKSLKLGKVNETDNWYINSKTQGYTECLIISQS